MTRSSIVLGIAAAALLAGAGCERRKARKPTLGEVERLPRVETILLGAPSRVEIVRSYTATVEAMEKADLCAMVKGSVKDLPATLDIGRTVKKNEVLFALDVPDLIAERDNKKALVEQAENAEALALQAIEVARAEVKEAQALALRYTGEATFRRAQYDRVSRLAHGDTLSRQQMEEAKLQLDAADSALAAAQAQIETKQAKFMSAQKDRLLAAARVKSARTDEAKAAVQVEFATIRAPFDGVITKRWVDTGTTVKDAGMPLFTLMRTDWVRVVLDVPERAVPYLRAGPQGNPVHFQIPALKEAGGLDGFAGTLTLLAGALDPVTRTMRVEMHLENQAGALKPQMTGTAFVTLAERNALMVPSSALMRLSNKTEICIVADPVGDQAKGTIKRMEVRTGLDDGQRVEIQNGNLTGRELVVVRGGGVLRTGDAVIAIPSERIGSASNGAH